MTVLLRGPGTISQTETVFLLKQKFIYCSVDKIDSKLHKIVLIQVVSVQTTVPYLSVFRKNFMVRLRYLEQPSGSSI